MFGGVHKSNKVGMILLSLERPKILVVEVLLKDNSVVILVNIDVEGILSLYFTGNRVDSIFVFVGISIEGDLLSDCNTDSEIFSSWAIQFEEIFIVRDVSIAKLVPFIIEVISLLVGNLHWLGLLVFYIFQALIVF